MSGKQAKREKRLAKEAARQAARRQERQRTIFTLIVIGVIVAIGGTLIYLSYDSGEEELAADPTEEPTPTDAASPDAETREVACAAAAPASAGQDKPVFSADPPDVLEEGVDYRATIDTSCGQVVVDLAEDRAPVAVNSFVFLARNDFFDGLEIFRNATSIGALQTGSGTNEAAFSIGYTLPDELEFAQQEGYPPGSVALANAGPNTSGSQFFFVYNDKFELPPNYTRFATVVEGLDVLEKIGAIPVEGETPTELIYIDQVTITADGQPVGEPVPAPTAATPEPTAEPTPQATSQGTPEGSPASAPTPEVTVESGSGS